MFLKMTAKRNPALMTVARQLHQDGAILPDTYVLDLDAILANATHMAAVAQEHQVELYYMLKQIGRNPLVARRLTENTGIRKAVAVDYKEALTLMTHGLPLGNVGHLVQVPNQLLVRIMEYGVDYLTVYSLDKLRQIIQVAANNRIHQNILLKVIEPGDTVYDGQYGGFHLEELADAVNLAAQSPYVQIKGVTVFPCFLYDGAQALAPTPNYQTLLAAKERLATLGIADLVLNMPSATCTATIPVIHQLGGHQGEPGHALTGTTPLHAVSSQPEVPALVYVSEISHNLDGCGYFYGGGYYRRGHFQEVAIYEPGADVAVRDQIEPLDEASIDYYIKTHHSHPVGATVIGAFRTQIFVTRSDVAIVSGIQSGRPVLEGIYDGLGNQIRR